MSRSELAPAERIMVALDVDELAEAKQLIDDLGGYGVTFKVGNQLGTYEGWQNIIQYIHDSGAKVFCDTKYKDIPTTIRKSARAISRHAPDFFNVMADNTIESLESAVTGVASAVEEFGVPRPVSLGVTVLTTINDQECHSIYGGDTKDKVMQFANYAAASGLDGVVCSAEEVELLRSDQATSGLILVTPGIRPLWAASNDQKRIVTPSEAIRRGSDYLVIGRPITDPPEDVGSSRKAVELIIKELEGVA